MGLQDDSAFPSSPDSQVSTQVSTPDKPSSISYGGGLPYDPVPAAPRGSARRPATPPQEGICIPPVLVASVAIGVLAAGFFIGFSAGAVGLPVGPTDTDRISTLEAQLAGTLAHIERIEGGIAELHAEKQAVVPFNTTATPRGLLARVGGKGGGAAILLALIGGLGAFAMLGGKDKDTTNGQVSTDSAASAASSAATDSRIRELSAAVQLVEASLKGKADSANGAGAANGATGAGGGGASPAVDARVQELSLAVQRVEATAAGKGDSAGGQRRQEVDTHLRKLDAAVHIIRSSLNKKADTSEVAESVQRSVCGGVTRVEWELTKKDFNKYKLGDEIKSPEFSMGCINGLDLRFYPRGVKHGSATHCALFLGAPKNTRLKCRLSVDGASSREGEHDYQKGLAFFGVVEFGPVKPAYSSVAVELVSGHQETETPETGEKLIHRFEVPSVKTNN